MRMINIHFMGSLKVCNGFGKRKRLSINSNCVAYFCAELNLIFTIRVVKIVLNPFGNFNLH